MEPINVELDEQILQFTPNVNKIMTPMRMIIAGPSQSGKTRFMVALVKYREAIFNTKFSRILYCVPPSANESHQAVFEELKSHFPQTEYFLDLPKMPEIVNDNLPKLVLLDDLMEKLFNSKDWETIFTTFSHHNSCSVAFTSQNYFLGKSKTIIRQCNYTVIFDSPTNKTYLRTISCQLEPISPNFLNNIFLELDSLFPTNNYKYILVDGNAQSPMKRLKIRTNIFPNPDGSIEPICFFPCR